MLQLFTRDGARADQALQFLRQHRPRTPWTFISEGRRIPRVASFLPTVNQQIDAARTWIIAAQRRGFGVLTLIGQTETALFRPFEEREIVSSANLVLSIPGGQSVVTTALEKIPRPTALIHTGRAITALYRLGAAVPMGTATLLARSLAERCGGEAAWLMPLPGTLRPNGKPVKIIYYHPNRTYRPDDLRPATAPRQKITRASSVQPAQIDWLWRHMIPRGELTIIAGRGSAGKTTMCLQLAAAISRGAAWPDGTPAPKGRTIVIEGEDPVDTVTVPRLIAAGADLDRVTLVDQGGEMLTAADLEDAAAGVEDLRLVVLSPIRRLIHDNQAANTEIRRRLEPLIAWARKRRCGLVGIMHPLKGNDRQSADALAGSPAYTELSRATHLATVDEDDPEPDIRRKRRLLMAVKTNIAPEGMRFGYRIETAHAGDIETSRVVWETPRVAAATPALTRTAAALPHPAPDPIYATPAQAWLAARLADGPKLVSELQNDAEKAGFSRATLYRAATGLGVTRTTATAGGKLWQLRNSAAHR